MHDIKAPLTEPCGNRNMVIQVSGVLDRVVGRSGLPASDVMCGHTLSFCDYHGLGDISLWHTAHFVLIRGKARTVQFW